MKTVVWIQNLSLIAVAALFLSCGGSDVQTSTDAGSGPPPECYELSDCGAGKPNHITVSFCTHCFARPDTHLCESGQCQALDVSGRISFAVGIPSSARGAKSWTQASLNPVRSDGVSVSCASALSSTDYNGNGHYNTGNSNFKNFATSGGADPALAYPSNIVAAVGQGRMLIVRVMSDTQGKGQLMAQGCVGDIEVKANDEIQVNLVLAAP